jgi:ubiquinone biosynthesis protein COQ9
METPSPLEQLRRRLALAVGENAVFDGWTRKAVDSAAAQLGAVPVQARLAFPKSPAGMIDCYLQEVDRALEAWFTPDRLKTMKIRARIRSLVWHRQNCGSALIVLRPGGAALPVHSSWE